jgi:outer membrane lipoprotein-sorting protein
MTTLLALIEGISVAFVFYGPAQSKSSHNISPAIVSKSVLEARTLLKRVLLSEDQVSFRGTQTVVFASGQKSEATVTTETYLPGNRYRIQYRLPRAVAGKIIVSNGSKRWEYDPRQRVITHSVSSWKPMTPDNAARVCNRIAACYFIKVLPAAATVSDRRVFLLEFSSRWGDRPRQQWWIDRTTFLVLKREVVDPDGMLHSTSTYSTVRFSQIPKPSDIELKAPPGVRTVTRERTTAVGTVRQAREDVPAWAKVRDNIGQGFDFESAIVTDVQGNPTVHLQYTDGLVGVSLIQMAGNAHVHAGGGPVRSVKVGNSDGRLIQHSRFKILSWRLPSLSLSLVADLPETTLVTIARGLR